jgi:hypothetical protein
MEKLLQETKYICKPIAGLEIICKLITGLI